ncbi:phosphatidylinositol synthase [Plakobranchus ocellatus]|uniref:Phosphatidylinositol synthase n=1 Tax=Plakobranchus ocellatus TaxID=259542 RepID=A0AAV3ZLK3_9GAST|nr:phosphatidylinositol synthase [Plakobranchus ocellatus]
MSSRESANLDPQMKKNRDALIDKPAPPVRIEVLLFIPNIIGYIRIFLACCAFASFQEPAWFMALYTSSIALDGVDGFVARKLNQCTKFGAWFDVIIDLFSRGYLWCALFRWGYIIIFLEWVTFLSTHSRGEHWKIPEEKFPALVTMVMANGFKTPAGFFAVGSLHVLPLWLYGYESRFFTQNLGLPMWLQLTCIAILTFGRTVCSAVELFYCKEYVLDLLRH